jgi:hypothetical protein
MCVRTRLESISIRPTDHEATWPPGEPGRASPSNSPLCLSSSCHPLEPMTASDVQIPRLNPPAAEKVSVRLMMDAPPPGPMRAHSRNSSANILPVVFRTRPAAACAARAATHHSICPALRVRHATRRAFHPEIPDPPSFPDWTQLCRPCCRNSSSSIENSSCKKQCEETTPYCSVDCRRVASLGKSPVSCCP